jgi:hypothetical protein
MLNRARRHYEGALPERKKKLHCSSPVYGKKEKDVSLEEEK